LSLADLLPAELNQPRILGDSGLGASDVVMLVVPGKGRLVACLGVDDLVIVDMPDAILVTTRPCSQEVKRLVKKAKDAGWVGIGCYEHMSSPHTYPPIYTFGNTDLGFQLFYCSRLPFRPLPLQTIRFLKQNRSTVIVSLPRFTMDSTKMCT
jgi:hypothetical protein